MFRKPSLLVGIACVCLAVGNFAHAEDIADMGVLTRTRRATLQDVLEEFETVKKKLKEPPADRRATQAVGLLACALEKFNNKKPKTAIKCLNDAIGKLNLSNKAETLAKKEYLESLEETIKQYKE